MAKKKTKAAAPVADPLPDDEAPPNGEPEAPEILDDDPPDCDDTETTVVACEGCGMRMGIGSHATCPGCGHAMG